jgi:hypothetical protein
VCEDDLIAQASAHELTRSLAHWSKVGERESGNPLSAVADAYLTRSHRDNPGRVVCWLRWGRTCRDRVRPYGTPSPTMCVPSAIFWPSWFRANRKRRDAERHSARTQHWWAQWSLARAVDDRDLSLEILDVGRASVKG